MSIADQLSNGSSGLIDESADQNDDPTFTSRELERFDYQLLRNLAANANTEAINGKSPMMIVKSYFRCQHTLDEFE